MALENVSPAHDGEWVRFTDRRLVMILSTDKVIKAAILCDRLTWAGIAYSFELVGTCYTVSVAEQHVKAALGSDL